MDADTAQAIRELRQALAKTNERIQELERRAQVAVGKIRTP